LGRTGKKREKGGRQVNHLKARLRVQWYGKGVGNCRGLKMGKSKKKRDVAPPGNENLRGSTGGLGKGGTFPPF